MWGSGVMMQAKAHSPLKLLVDVGLGFHAECNIVEAQQIASLQEVAAQVSRCHGPALDQSLAIISGLVTCPHTLTFSFRQNQSSSSIPQDTVQLQSDAVSLHAPCTAAYQRCTWCAQANTTAYASAMEGATGQAATTNAGEYGLQKPRMQT